MEGEADASMEELAELLPAGADFQIRSSPSAGRYMVAARALPAGFDFLLESPVAAWPLMFDEATAEQPAAPVTPFWCEGCFRALPARGRRRLRGKQGPPGGERPGGAPGIYCPECAARREARGLPPMLTRELLGRWRAWQAAKSPGSRIGLEAFGRALAHVAEAAQALRARFGLGPEDAARAALRTFERLAGPPPGSAVTLHGTYFAEVAAELARSEPFAQGVRAAAGCPCVAAQLLSEASVELLAGRLVLNSAGFEIQHEAGLLRGGGVFVFLSMLNHSCGSTVEAAFRSGSGSEATLRTRRPVAAGEPLTLAYVSEDLPVAERRAKLKHWMFDCDCWRCESELHILAAMAPAEAGAPAAAAEAAA